MDFLTMAKIKVLIVDDSALVRRVLTEILTSDEAIEVIGTASDPHMAREKIKKLNPDVLTLDVEMPKMDGISFLRNLMRLRPMPVIMVSSLTEEGADVTLKALELGAIDFVQKPKVEIAQQLEEYSVEIIAKIKMAALARVQKYVPGKEETNNEVSNNKLDIEKRYTTTTILQRSAPIEVKGSEPLIAIGASTGGTEAIKEILMHMPPDSPRMVIAQHIPLTFSAAFANRMDSVSQMVVKEATDGQLLIPGHAFIAPGDQHLILVHEGDQYRCKLNHGPPVNRHRPSVDVLFRSVAQTAGKNAIGILLTGMGTDGARGLKEMQDAGASTIAQDEKTSVVWGMPGEAVKMGAADHVLALDRIVGKIDYLLNKENKH